MVRNKAKRCWYLHTRELTKIKQCSRKIARPLAHGVSDPSYHLLFYRFLLILILRRPPEASTGRKCLPDPSLIHSRSGSRFRKSSNTIVKLIFLVSEAPLSSSMLFGVKSLTRPLSWLFGLSFWNVFGNICLVVAHFPFVFSPCF